MNGRRPGGVGLPVDVFISYSHEDERFRRLLEQHLSLLQREGILRAWHDRKLTAGTEWEGAIHDALERAAVVLLLVSPSFMASRYAWDIEMERAMERHRAGEARVIPVLLRVVDWERAPFATLQALPSDGKFVTKWRDRDAALTTVVKGIRQAILEMGAAVEAIGAAPLPAQPAVERRPVAPPAPLPGAEPARFEQVAAVCYRRGAGGLEILLVRSSGGRWLFPKGRMDPGELPWQAAVREAHEEGGVSGTVDREPFTTFLHLKRRPPKADLEVQVGAFLFEVSRSFEPPEEDRKPTWFAPEAAIAAAGQERAFRYASEYRRVIEEATRRASERG